MIEMHENLKKIGVKRTEQKVSGLGKAAWRKKTKRLFFFSARVSKFRPLVEGQHCAKVSSKWQVDINHALRVCGGSQTQIEASEPSYVSFDRLDDPWPS